MQVCFLKIKKKCLECSETKEYAKIFCELFEMVSVKNLDIFQNISLNIDMFINIFPLEPKVFFFQNHLFQAFLVSKTYIYIYM